MQIWDEPGKLQTPPYVDTQGIMDTENGRKPRGGTKKSVNGFFTNLPPKTRTSIQYNDLP